jgi:hypothetical protein
MASESCVVGVDGVAAMCNACCVESDIGQQAPIGHGEKRRLVVGGGVDQVYVFLIFGKPVFVVPDQDVPVLCVLSADGEAGTTQMQRVGGDSFHAIEHHQVIKVRAACLGHAS